ncbi:MAG: J domain-containing protein [Deinococcota bacterium]
MAQDHYHILGITEDADLQEVRSAYRQLAKVHHPDLNPGDPYADALFQRINAAYSVLSNPESRRDYDLVRQHTYEPQADVGRTETRPSATSTQTTGWSKRRSTNTSQQDVNPGDFTDEFLRTDIFATMMARNIKEQLRGPAFDLRALPVEHYVILGVLAIVCLLLRLEDANLSFSVTKWLVFAVYVAISTWWAHGLRSLERFRPDLLGRFDIFIVHAASFVATAMVTPPLMFIAWAAQIIPQQMG